MIQQAAFKNTGNKMLKGGLHCHTTRSDGRVSPEEVLKMHVANGYDFLALTDHRYYNYANYGDAPLTIIPGMEMDRNFEGPGIHCYHTVAIGPSREDGNGFEQDQQFERGVVHGPEDMQPLVDWIRANNNLAFYCHPEWSGTPAREFESIEGFFAMEVWNSSCAIGNDCDKNAAYWDELLRKGKKIFGVATDDGHQPGGHCNGWVRVNAENNIRSILTALENGAFYASCGPVIRDFYINDEGIAVVDCSPGQYVSFHTNNQPPRLVRAEKSRTTHAEYKVPDYAEYLRVCVVDAGGNRAWSNPIFLK